MSSTITQARPLAPDPATFKTVLFGIVDALPRQAGATPDDIAAQSEAAFLAISALRPRNRLEAMLAARIASAYFHAMHSLAGAVQPTLPVALQLRYQGRAITLSRLMDASLRTLLNRQVAPAHQPRDLPAADGHHRYPQPAPQAAQPNAPSAPETVPTDPPPAPLQQAAAPWPAVSSLPAPAACPTLAASTAAAPRAEAAAPTRTTAGAVAA